MAANVNLTFTMEQARVLAPLLQLLTFTVIG